MQLQQNPKLVLLREYSKMPLLTQIEHFYEKEEKTYLQGQRVLPVVRFTQSIPQASELKDFTVSLGATNSGRSLASTNSYTWRHYEIQASHNIVEQKKKEFNLEGLEVKEQYQEGLLLSDQIGTSYFVPSVQIQLTVSKSSHQDFTLKAELQFQEGFHLLAKSELRIISPFIVKYASLQNLSRSPHCPGTAEEVVADSLLRVCLRNNSSKVIYLSDIDFLLNSSIYSAPDQVQSFPLTVGSQFVQNYFHKCYRISLLPKFQEQIIIPGEEFTYAMLIKRVEPLPPEFKQTIILNKPKGRRSAESVSEHSLNQSSLLQEEDPNHELNLLKIMNSQFAGSFSTPMLFLYKVDGIRNFMTQEILIRWHLLNSKALEIDTLRLAQAQEEEESKTQIIVKLTVKSNLDQPVRPRFTFLNISERTYIPELLSFQIPEIVAQGQASRVITFKKRRKISTEPVTRLVGKIEAQCETHQCSLSLIVRDIFLKKS